MYYLARDFNGSLCLFKTKPKRFQGGGCESDTPYWNVEDGSYVMEFYSEDFPNLKWEDEPLEIDLVVKTPESQPINE